MAQFLKDISVVYGAMESQIPLNAIRTLDGGSSDINQGFGGKYVWISANYSGDSNPAITALQVFIQEKEDSTRDDLAKGAHGYFRYVVPHRDGGNNSKITNVALLRSGERVGGPPAGYDTISDDLNRERGGSFLYLVSKHSG